MIFEFESIEAVKNIMEKIVMSANVLALKMRYVSERLTILLLRSLKRA